MSGPTPGDGTLPAHPHVVYQDADAAERLDGQPDLAEGLSGISPSIGESVLAGVKAIPPYPGPVWKVAGYTSEQAFADAAYRATFGHEPPPAAVVTRQAALIELPGLRIAGSVRQEISPHGQGDALHSLGELDQSLILEVSLRVPRVLHGAVRKLLWGRVGHNASPSLGADNASVGDEAAPGDEPQAHTSGAGRGADT